MASDFHLFSTPVKTATFCLGWIPLWFHEKSQSEDWWAHSCFPSLKDQTLKQFLCWMLFNNGVAVQAKSEREVHQNFRWLHKEFKGIFCQGLRHSGPYPYILPDWISHSTLVEAPRSTDSWYGNFFCTIMFTSEKEGKTKVWESIWPNACFCITCKLRVIFTFF